MRRGTSSLPFTLSTVLLMSNNVTIRRLTQPSDRELDQVASVVLECFKDDSVTRAGCSGDQKLMYSMHRSVAAGAAVGAHLFVADIDDTQEIVGAAAFYGPGVEICGDELQRAQGFDGFLGTLPEAGLQWWGNFMLEYAAVTDAVIGPGVKKNSWTLNNLAVIASHRGCGIGRKLLEAGESLAREDGLPMIFEAEGKDNTGMYEHFGYRVIGQNELQGGNDVADFVVTILRKDLV